MEGQKLKITKTFYNPETDELDLVVNADAPRPAVSVVADDEHYFFLRIDPETNAVVGATIFHASQWFGELARSFQDRAWDDRSVRFLLEHLIESLALEKS